MDDFEKAQKLFKKYEKSGAGKCLGESLEILNEIVRRQDPDSQKAINLKNTIGKYLDTLIRDICERCNIHDFSNNLKNGDDLISFLNGSLSEEEAIKFMQLFSMRIKYFEKG